MGRLAVDAQWEGDEFRVVLAPVELRDRDALAPFPEIEAEQRTACIRLNAQLHQARIEPVAARERDFDVHFVAQIAEVADIPRIGCGQFAAVDRAAEFVVVVAEALDKVDFSIANLVAADRAFHQADRALEGAVEVGDACVWYGQRFDRVIFIDVGIGHLQVGNVEAKCVGGFAVDMGFDVAVSGVVEHESDMFDVNVLQIGRDIDLERHVCDVVTQFARADAGRPAAQARDAAVGAFGSSLVVFAAYDDVGLVFAGEHA